MIATKIIKENNLEPPRFKENKTFLARFGNKNNSNATRSSPKNTEIVIKCINENPTLLPKKSSPEPVKQVVNNEISVLSNNSIENSDENLSSSKSNIDLMRSSVEMPNNGCKINDDRDVNIIHFDANEKSKMRSQFMQKFVKREIQPQLIDIKETRKDDEKMLDTRELESKINGVMAQLDELKKREVKSQENDERRDVEERIKDLLDMKLKYIEKLQENQVQMMSKLITRNNEREYDKYARSPSPKKTNKNRKKTRSRSKSHEFERSSTSSPVTYEPSYGCLQCELNKACKTHRNVNKLKTEKGDFLKELLDLSSPVKEQNKFNEKETRVQPMVSLASPHSTANSYNLLFDKYLTQNKDLEQLKKAHKQKENELKEISVRQALPASPQKSSLFSDFDEVLRDIENSKSQLENDVQSLLLNRDNNLFNHIIAENSHSNLDEKENIRMHRLVDGYLDAISNEVKKEVSQEIIDQSKHAKLEAEKDEKQLSSRGRYLIKNQAKPLPPTSNTKPKVELKSSEKFLKSMYGKDLLDKLSKEKSNTFDWSSNTKLSSRTDSLLDDIHVKNDDIFDRIIAKPVQMPKMPDAKKPAQSCKTQVQKTFVKHVPAKQIQAPPKSKITQNSNVSFASVPYKEPEKEIKVKKLNIQKQPAINISSNLAIDNSKPSSQKPKLNLVETIIHKEEQESKRESDNEEVDDMNNQQQGSGIQLPGYHSDRFIEPKKIINQIPKASKLDNNLNYQIQPSSDDLAEKLKTQDFLENKALDWIEQELMARFVCLLTKNQNNEQELIDSVYNNQISFSNQSTVESDLSTSQNESVLVGLLGTPGFQVFVDNGQQIDADLIQALTREVLEEQINALLREEPKQAVAPPQPAKRSFERNSNENLFININRVPTPVVTPREHLSPETSPLRQRPRTPILTPNETINQEPAQVIEAVQESQFIQNLNPKVVEISEANDTLTMSSSKEEEEESELVELVLDAKLIIQPTTPQETPRVSPSRPLTPVLSLEDDPPKLIIPPPPPPQQQQVVVQASIPKKVSSVSIQVDEVPKIVSQGPIKTKSPDQTTLTDSSSYSSESTSTLATQDDDISESDISYLSEGAWAISKSEGQIVQLVPNVAICANFSEGSTSDGEFRPYQNQVTHHQARVSDGEVILPRVDRSEGDVLSSVSLRQGQIKKDKMIVNLRASKSDVKKNNILIQSISSDTNQRESREFDRKVISSTPDSTTAFNLKKFELPQDLLEYRIQTSNSLDMVDGTHKKITINMPTSFDDYEDTFSNVSDM